MTEWSILCIPIWEIAIWMVLMWMSKRTLNQYFATLAIVVILKSNGAAVLSQSKEFGRCAVQLVLVCLFVLVVVIVVAKKM